MFAIVDKSIVLPSFSAVLFAGSVLAAPDVYIKDSESTDWEPCGPLNSLEVTKDRIDIDAALTCLGSDTGGGTWPTVQDQGSDTSRIAVDSGSSVVVNVSDGAVVQLPVPAAPVEITDNPTATNASVTLLFGSEVRYNAPGSDDIIGDVDDQFKFRLTDGTGGTDEAWVYIHVNHVPGNGSACVPSTGLYCKGELIGYPWGIPNTTHHFDGADDIHAWEFVYGGEIMKIGPKPGAYITKNISISTIAGGNLPANAEEPDCYKEQLSSSASMEVGLVAGDCNLTSGVTYFLNIQNKGIIPDSYYISNSSQ